MPSEPRQTVIVYLDSDALGARQEVGQLIKQKTGSKTILCFQYAPDWLVYPERFAISPELPLGGGEQYFDGLPGILSDIAPDRWGRTLMERREMLQAIQGKQKLVQLDDWDFLVGVNDATRIGAIRLADKNTGSFLAAEALIVPPHAQLRELEHFAAILENGLPDNIVYQSTNKSALSNPKDYVIL